MNHPESDSHLSDKSNPISSDKKTYSISVKEGAPVMCCQTAAGGPTTRLERGAAPSTPRCRRTERRRLSKLMFFRCTPEEKLLIEFNAAKAGLERSSYMRAQSTGKPVMRAYRRIRADWDELRRCMGVINRAGNVVNQLVLELRRMGRSSGLAHVALKELSDAARSIMNVLGRL